MDQTVPFGGLNIRNVKEPVKPNMESGQVDLEPMIYAVSPIFDHGCHGASSGNLY
jgi:hypothetical protein